MELEGFKIEVLITGGSGLVGKNLVELLEKNGMSVDSPGRGELDLLEKKHVDDYLKRKSPEVVVHCAGLVGGIQANIARPYDFASKNYLMGYNLIDGCLKNNVAKVINLGSSCMYPKEAMNPLIEESILTGTLEPTNEGYAIAKIAISRLCAYANMQFGTKYKTLIPCNIYGKFDDFSLETSHLIPGVMHRMHATKHSGKGVITVWGDGEARREFMYASDLAEFICFSIEKYDKIPELMNVGMGFDFSIREYYDMISEIVGFKGSFDFDLSKPVGMKKKLVDTSIQKKLGWTPPTEMIDGLRKTYSYFLEHY